MIGGDNPLYMKFWVKLTPFLRKHLFSGVVCAGSEHTIYRVAYPDKTFRQDPKWRNYRVVDLKI